MNKKAKILLLAGKGQSSRIVYHYLAKHFTTINCIVEEKPSRIKFLKRRAKRLGWFTVIGQVVFQLFVPKILAFFSKKRKKEIIEKFQLNISPIPSPITKNVLSVNSKESRAFIQSFQPDIIILNGTRIVSRKVLSSTTAKFINTHLGITPMYRGVHGGYWALAKGEQENCGTTIHYVDAGIDTGNILKQVFVQPSLKDNFSTYPLFQLAVALPSILEAITEILENRSILLPNPAEKSQLWYHPTIFQYIANYFREDIF